MTPQELDKRVSPFALPDKIRYALAVSLQDEILIAPDDYSFPYWVYVELSHKKRLTSVLHISMTPCPAISLSNSC